MVIGEEEVEVQLSVIMGSRPRRWQKKMGDADKGVKNRRGNREQWVQSQAAVAARPILDVFRLRSRFALYESFGNRQSLPL